MLTKGILIPTPEEILEKENALKQEKTKLEAVRQLHFIKKANDCKIGEKIANIISKQMVEDINKSFRLHVSSNINLTDAVKYIETIVKPIFKDFRWNLKTFPYNGDQDQYCQAYWITELEFNFRSKNWINEIFRVEKLPIGPRWFNRYIQISLNQII